MGRIYIEISSDDENLIIKIGKRDGLDVALDNTLSMAEIAKRMPRELPIGYANIETAPK